MNIDITAIVVVLALLIAGGLLGGLGTIALSGRDKAEAKARAQIAALKATAAGTALLDAADGGLRYMMGQFDPTDPATNAMVSSYNQFANSEVFKLVRQILPVVPRQLTADEVSNAFKVVLTNWQEFIASVPPTPPSDTLKG